MKHDPSNRGPERMADLFCRHSRAKVDLLFDNIFDANDKPTYRVAQEVLDGKHAWMDPDMLV
jgi:hypothetical protein